MTSCSAESIRRLEAVIAGTQSKGAAGEPILEVVFAKLPPEGQVRAFRVGNKAVELGLRLPNDLVLPIDSKWAATGLLAAFVGRDDPEERHRLQGQIESAVLGKAREVQKYLDPGLTVGFGVAAVPDAVDDLCWGVHAEALQLIAAQRRAHQLQPVRAVPALGLPDDPEDLPGRRPREAGDPPGASGRRGSNAPHRARRRWPTSGGAGYAPASERATSSRSIARSAASVSRRRAGRAAAGC